MLKYLLLIFTSLAIISCSNSSSGEKAQVSDEAEVAQADENGGTYTINPDQSIAVWEGSKPTGKHTGTINVQSGNLTMDESGIASAMLVLDMNSIENSDQEGDMKGKLEGHLKSPDFFDVAQFPTAKFEMTKIAGVQNDPQGATHLLYGNLTIKDITKEIGVKAIVQNGDNAITVQIPNFKIDRTEFDVKYKSKKFFDNLKDKFIHDEMTVSVKMIASK